MNDIEIISFLKNSVTTSGVGADYRITYTRTYTGNILNGGKQNHTDVSSTVL